MSLLELIFSGNCTIDNLFEHNYFTSVLDAEFIVSTPVSVHFTDNSAEPLISNNSINLACFEQEARRPYQAHVAKLFEKN